MTFDDATLARRSLEIIGDGQAGSGAFVASPTFSQYGYAWLRDGAFVAESLDLIGQLTMSGRFHDWAADVVRRGAAGIERSIVAIRDGQAPDRADFLQCRYAMDGSIVIDDWPAFQSDGPGLWLWSLAHHVRHGGALRPAYLEALDLAARYLAALWATPCSDAWEEFAGHVHTSTQAAILAGLDAAESLAGAASRLPEVAEARDSLRRLLLAPGGGSWTKWVGTSEVDASLLWIAAPYALVDVAHPRFAMTLRRIEEELESADGGVYRYLGDTYYGGGEWLLLTSALARARLRRDAPGDRQRALDGLRWMSRQAGPDGALPEQVAHHALHPERVDGWQEAWGESAQPLLWSHASWLSLRSELQHAGRLPGE